MIHQLEPTMLEFFHYNHWANQELMRICIGLSDGILTASNPGAYGSIRETFTHILKADAVRGSVRGVLAQHTVDQGVQLRRHLAL